MNPISIFAGILVENKCNFSLESSYITLYSNSITHVFCWKNIKNFEIFFKFKIKFIQTVQVLEFLGI